MTDQRAANPGSRTLERGLLTNGLGIIVKSSRVVYLILFSRLLGAEGFGIYLLAFAIQELVSKFGILGLNWGGKQMVGYLKAEGEQHAIRPTVIRILWLGIIFSSIVAFGLALGSEFVASAMGKESLAAPLRIFALGIPFLCGMYVLVYSFRPRLDMRYELYVTSIIEPVSVLLIGVALLQRSRSVEMLACAHVAAAATAFLAAVHIFNRLYPSGNSRGPARVDWKMLIRGSTAMGGMEIVNNFQTRVDLFLLALYFPAHVIGIYGAAAEIASLLRKSKAAFDPILMPIAQGLYLTGNRARLQQEVSRAVNWALYIGLGLLGLLILLPEPLLGLFGSEFSGTTFSTVLVILAAGQFFNMSLGLSEGILAITGFAHLTLASAAVLIASEVALLLLLIPGWGLTGAAVAASLPFVGVTLWRIAQARRLLGVGMLTAAQSPILLSWAGCLGLALLLSAIVTQQYWINMTIAVLAFMASYGLLSWRFHAPARGLSA